MEFIFSLDEITVLARQHAAGCRDKNSGTVDNLFLALGELAGYREAALDARTKKHIPGRAVRAHSTSGQRSFPAAAQGRARITA